MSRLDTITLPFTLPYLTPRQTTLAVAYVTFFAAIMIAGICLMALA
jgi:hypothetical protein